MTFTPPYWNHKRTIFPRAEIDRVISDIKSNPIEYNNISSYPANRLRPEARWLDRYSKIIGEFMSDMGLFKRNSYTFSYWAQLYLNNHDHKIHNHLGDGATISFVHFIRPSPEPLFRFSNFNGEYHVPQKQTAGEILCYPAWLWHEVLPNESNIERFIVAGNVAID